MSSKERVKRYRERQKALHIATPLQEEGVTVDKEKAIKLLKVCNALNCDIMGLGKRENMLDLVRFGCGGPTMREVKAQLFD